MDQSEHSLYIGKECYRILTLLPSLDRFGAESLKCNQGAKYGLA